jgi:hypothetical protein
VLVRPVDCHLAEPGNSHVVQVGNLSLLVTDDWEAQLAAGDLINILDPASVRLDGVCRETDQFDASLGKLGLQLCKSAKFGGADGGVILWVGEQHHPLVANELMEVDWAGGSLSLEVWSDGSQAEARGGVGVSKAMDGLMDQ